MELDRDLFEYVLAPIVSAQLFFTILMYFIVVRRRIAVDYKLYSLFLLSFVLFLLGRMTWVGFSESAAIVILYIRMGLFLAIGIPSLLIAAAKQAGIRSTIHLYLYPYLTGFLIAIAYILFYDYGTLAWFVIEDFEYGSIMNSGVSGAHNIQIFGALVQLVIPCFLLLLKELLGKRQLKLILFLSGGLLFGLTLVVGLGSKPQNIGLYYIGSIPVGIMWIWAVFLDIKDLKGKVTLLKEELQLLLRSNNGIKSNEIKALLENLEEVSHGNLDIYKMRIREILNMLTDTTIEAGGDSETLIQRNVDRGCAIQKSSDNDQVKEIIFNEALELYEIISDIPSQKNAAAIQKVLAFLDVNYAEDVSADDIANMAGISKAHLMREFKKSTEQTILQYQTKLRIEASKKWLKSLSVTETAYKVGYNNPNYFSTVFKKVTGKSPIEFQGINNV